ncbi:MAG: phage holin family protein [Patescibacteria group bacterium]
MPFIVRFAVKIALNGLALYAATRLFPTNLTVTGGIGTIFSATVVLALIMTFVRPVIRFVTTPLRWITFGLFNIVINIALLLAADYLLPAVSISGFWPIFWTSFIIAFANTII